MAFAAPRDEGAQHHTTLHTSRGLDLRSFWFDPLFDKLTGIFYNDKMPTKTTDLL